MHTASTLLGLATFLAATPVLAAANVRVEIPAPAPTQVYEEIDYSVLVSNNGNKSASAVVLRIDLPKTNTSPQVYVMGDLGAYDPRCTRSGARLTCNLGTLAKLQTTAVTFSIALPVNSTPLSITASATTSSAENTTADNADSDTPALLHPSYEIVDGDLAHNRHCTGQGLTSFFECVLFPSSISEHDALFHGDGTISFPEAPEYGGAWSQTTTDTLAFVYTLGEEVVAEFEGQGAAPGCFEGIVHFPGSEYLSPYEVCF